MHLSVSSMKYVQYSPWAEGFRSGVEAFDSMYKTLHVDFYNCIELYLRLTEQRTGRASCNHH